MIEGRHKMCWGYGGEVQTAVCSLGEINQWVHKGSANFSFKDNVLARAIPTFGVWQKSE
jgi:hypothetical protein